MRALTSPAMRHLAFSVTVALCAAMIAGMSRPVALAQGRGAGPIAAQSSMHLVSPSVVATWTTRNNPDGSKTRLLVLWRGTPGWMSRGDRGHGFGSGSYDGYWLSARGITFTVEFDFDRDVARILNWEISLVDTDVVLVDFADRPIGPAIAGFQWIDFPRLDPAIADPVPSIIQHTPALFDYLQCEARSSDPTMEALRPVLCNQVRPIK